MLVDMALGVNLPVCPADLPDAAKEAELGEAEFGVVALLAAAKHMLPSFLRGNSDTNIAC